MAEAINARFGVVDPRVRRAADALATMPGWAEKRRLDLWEEHVQAELDSQPPSDDPLSLVDAVFEFGRANLYTAFNREQTAEAFGELHQRLSRLGLKVNRDQSVAEW